MPEPIIVADPHYAKQIEEMKTKETPVAKQQNTPQPSADFNLKNPMAEAKKP